MEQKALHRFFLATSLLSMVLMVCVGAKAATVEIISYNIEQTPESGFGCWNHKYTGTITDTGYTVSGSVNCSAHNPAHLQNYYNGSGTLNDGLFDTTHLFITTCPYVCRYNDQGGDITPVITLNLKGTNTINEIRLLQTGFTNITGVTVQIGTSETQVTPIAINDALNVRLNLIGTNLETLPTNQIILKNFSASFYGNNIDQFGIGEIQVDGTEVVLNPTSKDQCKKNGWKIFGFEDQGQCIEFVTADEQENEDEQQ